MEKIILFGVGEIAEKLLQQIGYWPNSVEIVGFADNDSSRWGHFFGKPVFSPYEMLSYEFDYIIIMSDYFYHTIKEDLVYWYHIAPEKIKRRQQILKWLLLDKYKDTNDKEIQDIFRYWENSELSVFNQYVKDGMEEYEVFWDCIENMPYIIFEDKKMYYPYDYNFQIINGKKVIKDILSEQQSTSPHLYIKDDIKIDAGDVIADVGVYEGNFSLRYIEKVSKAYLFECDQKWKKPLEKTFEKFSDKVVLCDKFANRYDGRDCVKLDTVINSTFP